MPCSANTLLFGPSPNQLSNAGAGRYCRIRVIHLVICDLKNTFLLGAFPVWECAALDMKRHESDVLGINRIGAEVGNTPAHSLLILLRSSRQAVVGFEFGAAWPDDHEGEPLAVQDEGALCVGPIGRNLLAILLVRY